MKKIFFVVITGVALIFGCKKDSTNNSANTSTNTQTAIIQNTSLIGVWVQDSSFIIGNPPTTKDSTQRGKYPGRVWDTLNIAINSFYEIGWWDWSDTTIVNGQSYEAYQFPSSTWQTPYSDSLFVSYVVSGHNDWTQHYTYTITGKELYIRTGYFSQDGLPLQESQPVEYWYHKIH